MLKSLLRSLILSIFFTIVFSANCYAYGIKDFEYFSNIDDANRLYVLNKKSGDLKRLTDNPAVDAVEFGNWVYYYDPSFT